MSEKVGRPTKLTPETIAQLENAFSYGASDVEACGIAGISKTALYNYQEKNPEFVDRKEYLKDMPKYRAKVNVVEKIREEDPDMSKWYLERKVKEEFSTRTEQTGKDGEPLAATINIIQPNGD